MLLAFLVILFVGFFAGNARAAGDFLESEDAFELTVEQSSTSPSSPVEIRLHWRIAQGYYLYRERIGVMAIPAESLQPIQKPLGDRKEDPTFGVTDVYHNAVTIVAKASGARELTVTWQGCADAGLCYPPQTRTIMLSTPADSALEQSLLSEPVKSITTASDSRITQLLGERTLIWTVPLFFLLGIALAFTPCVLPMVPIISGIVVGSQAAPRRAFALSLAFVLPMALTYAFLGAAAALAGANLQALLQNRWTVTAFGIVLLGRGCG